MTENALFLATVLINLFAICGWVGMLMHERLERPADMRLAWALIVLTFVGIALRGQPFEILSWPLVLLAFVLIVRSVRTMNLRIRTRRLLGRSVPHT